jgi:peroxiredoxin/predicted 2-oxoglutarate/Fe(II)-dependent dioxygenase YbiX
VLCFFGTAGDPASQRILSDFVAHREQFDDTNCCFFGVSIDPLDQQLNRVRDSIPGMRYFWDFDCQISAAYGAITEASAGMRSHPVVSRQFTLVLDERLRVLAVFPFDAPPEQHSAGVLDFVAKLPPIGPPTQATVQAPVLVVPHLFEPELCRSLIRYYEERGGEESGFMREQAGMTVAVHDYGHKRRRDQEVEDERLRRSCMVRIHDRLAPEIHKAFQFRATRIERYIVACYDASVGGHFRAHRDNTTRGTAHRRFAVSLHLNTGEYQGGFLRFPEFGPQLYVAPVGGAVVFSCSLLHEATPVTQGKRYMFLPFLYDEEAARIREQNRQFLASDATAQPTGEPSQPQP